MKSFQFKVRQHTLMPKLHKPHAPIWWD